MDVIVCTPRQTNERPLVCDRIHGIDVEWPRFNFFFFSSFSSNVRTRRYEGEHATGWAKADGWGMDDRGGRQISVSLIGCRECVTGRERLRTRGLAWYE